MARLDDKLWAAVLEHEDTELDPPASTDAIAAFVLHLGNNLPPSYRDFLLNGNGGIIGYVRLFGIGRSDALDLEQTNVEMGPYIQGMANVPIMLFASDWGGSYFCFDLSRPSADGEYPVLYWQHEYSEEPHYRPMLWSEFATNFVDFVRQVIA